jgi:hypothetical protein
MILRRNIFTQNPRAEFWHFVEALQVLKGDDEVNALGAFMSYVHVLRGTWKGTVLEWAWTVLDVVMNTLISVVPLPMRVRLRWDDPRARWRVRWLGWMFLWGLELDVPPGVTVLPPRPPGEFLTAEEIATFAPPIRVDSPEGEQPICFYCGVPTRMYAYTNLRDGSSWPACCSKDECLDRWGPLAQVEKEQA